MRLFRYLKNSIHIVLIIIALLIVQAYCDLSLPTYTGEIVDVGIMQGGIADAVPTQLRAQSLTELMTWMLAEEQQAVQAAYTLGDDNVYTLSDTSADTHTRLNEIFSIPMAVVTYGTMQPDTGGQPALDPSLTKEQIRQQVSDLMQTSGEFSETTINQVAVQYVRAEYEAMDMDMGALQMNYMLRTGAKMLGFTLVSVAAAVIVGFLASRTAADVGRRLRKKLYGKVLSFSQAEMDQFSTASLITRNTNDIQQIQMVTVMILRIVLYAPIMGAGGIIKVMNTHTGMEWIILVGVLAIILLVGTLMGVTLPKFNRMQKLVDRLNLVSREILTGLPVIRAFSREKHEEKRFDDASRDLMKTQLFTNRAMSFMFPFMTIIMNGISVAIVWFGAQGVDVGRLQVGDMMAFITYTMQVVMSFMMLTMISIMLPRANVSATRVDEVLAVEPTITDPTPLLHESKADWRGAVTFDDVYFRFPGADQDVLEGISFTARPGQTTAIIGSTGSGKSTIVNLVPRLYDVTQGRVTIDGIDIRDVSQHKLHDLIGFVPQKGVLFSGDIESNIKFGSDHVSDADMVRAAEIAQAADFIGEKEDTYHSLISQGGTNVSGGQKQRLSIARAIAKDPRIFIFDDSFSALDYKTDVALRRALNEQIGDATVIIVAQRISTILHADQILVLDDGRITGIGTHNELMQSCEAYREIARSQLSERELGENGGDVQ